MKKHESNVSMTEVSISTKGPPFAWSVRVTYKDGTSYTEEGIQHTKRNARKAIRAALIRAGAAKKRPVPARDRILREYPESARAGMWIGPGVELPNAGIVTRVVSAKIRPCYINNSDKTQLKLIVRMDVQKPDGAMHEMKSWIAVSIAAEVQYGKWDRKTRVPWEVGAK